MSVDNLVTRCDEAGGGCCDPSLSEAFGGGAWERLLRGGEVKEIYEMRGRGHSARDISRELGLARNTVLRYLKSPEAITPQPRPLRGPSWTLTRNTSTGGCRRGWKTARCCTGS